MAPRRLIFIIAAFFTVFLFTNLRHSSVAQSAHGKQPRLKELVVASVKGEDVSWIAEHVHDWKRNIYVVNDPAAALRVPKNKGRESMV